MATLTIRDLDDELKRRLRIRAAGLNRSMEEEARQILRAALTTPAEPSEDLFVQIRRAMAEAGPVDLPIAAREPLREGVDFSDPSFDPPRVARSSPRRRR